jgi:hypothetical protein
MPAEIPGCGPDLPVLDEDAVAIHTHLRIAALQGRRLPPVRRGALSVEQACFSQDERAGADTGNSTRLARRGPDEGDDSR